MRGDEVSVTFPDGHTATGRVLGHDVDGDIAVIGVETGDLEAIEWATDGAPGIGAPVFAVESSGRGLRVTLGFITELSAVSEGHAGVESPAASSTMRRCCPARPAVRSSAVRTTAGLNTHRLGEGFYLAIPADEALRARVDALGRGESQRRVRLGIGVAPSHVARGLRRAVGLPDADGLLVRLVEDDGPASRAGLAAGDLIIQAASEPVRGAG